MKIIVYILITFCLLGCNPTNCNKIPLTFKTYEQAVSVVEKSTFEFQEETTKSSSWIEDANYYSCDKKNGFLIIETSRQKYIHKDVPIKIWEEFNNSTSLGKYYNRNIKNKFQLYIEK
ncbi:MAG: KTSC domain-containing protein [Flavobacterium sp.]|jgi:hypothetical protein|uniref:KTSC domain-containing protein n=1 Tax=Flavobacterium sp. TaxID=239 RepID=UPI003BA5DC65